MTDAPDMEEAPGLSLKPSGDAGDAIDFALGHCEPEEALAFLDDWRADRVGIGIWPGYVKWLAHQRKCAAEAKARPASGEVE